MFKLTSSLRTKIQKDLNVNVLSKIGIFEMARFRLIPNNRIPHLVNNLIKEEFLFCNNESCR